MKAVLSLEVIWKSYTQQVLDFRNDCFMISWLFLVDILGDASSAELIYI